MNTGHPAGEAPLTSLEVEVCRRQGAIVDDRARRIVNGYVHCVETELALLPLRGE